MGAYMYPIKIDREPKKVRYTKDIILEDAVLTLADLRKYVTEDERFSFFETDEGIYSKTMLSISGERLETEEETKLRVEREESYMQEYNRRKAGK